MHRHIKTIPLANEPVFSLFTSTRIWQENLCELYSFEDAMCTSSQLHYIQSSPDYLIWPFPKKQHKHKTMLLEQSVYFFQLKEYHPFFQRNAGQNVCVCYYGRIASYPSPWYWGNTFTYIEALVLGSISLFTNAKIKAKPNPATSKMNKPPTSSRPIL